MTKKKLFMVIIVTIMTTVMLTTSVSAIQWSATDPTYGYSWNCGINANANISATAYISGTHSEISTTVFLYLHKGNVQVQWNNGSGKGGCSTSLPTATKPITSSYDTVIGHYKVELNSLPARQVSVSQ